MKNVKQGTLKRMFSYLKRYLPLVVCSVLLATAVVVFTLYVPILVSHAIDCIVEAGKVDFTALVPYLIKIGVCVGITAVCQWLMNVINNRITYHVVRDIRADAIRKIQMLPLRYIDSHSYGEIVSRVIADVDQFSDGLLMGFTQLFTGVITILGTLGFMLFLSWKITIAVVLITPLSLFVAKFIASRTYSMFREQSEVRGEQTAFIDEMIGNLKVVKAFSREDENLEAFDEVNGRLEKCSLKAIFFSSITNPATRFVNSVVYAAVALIGGFMVLSGGGFTVGCLTGFLSYANQYTKPFNEISGVVTELQGALACASRIFELLGEEELSPETLNLLPSVEGNVELEHVSFSYTPEKPLIRDFNLKVTAGKRIAIVGPTGCGKTTLINLLMRFYDVNEGMIYVDGFPIVSVPRSELRRNFGMVLQETWLRNRSVRENITMGVDYPEEKIVAAAKAAHAHSFILRLQNGYDTLLGEDGDLLSQGQKQLLCIARVMLVLPPMLILDEATSSIDTRTELKIQEAFAKMMEGRTSFIVAHRLSTIQTADRILVMKDGNVIEQGTHEELLEQNGFYADLYESQFEH